MDRWTREIVTEAERATSGSTLVVVAGTGSSETDRLAVPDRELVDAVEEAVPGDAPAVAATVPGGLFLDQAVLRDEQVTGQVAVDALLSASGPSGERMLADAFQGFAVSFARYCCEERSMAQIAERRPIAQLPRPADRRTVVAVGAILVGGRARRERRGPRADRVGPDVLRDLRLAADPGAAVRPARRAGRGARRGVRADRRVREARRDSRGRCSCPRPRWPGSRSRSASAGRCRWRAG